MHKHLLLIILALILALTNQAQKRLIEYGFTGGLTTNSASGSGVANMAQRNLIGFSMGGQIKINTSNNFGIRMILEYAQLGWVNQNLTFPDSSFSTGTVTFRMNYLNLPVMTEYSFGHKLKCNLEAGLFVGLLLTNQVITNLKGTFPPYRTTITKYSSDYRKSVNYGFAGGIGFELPVHSRTSIHLNFRDMEGLANVYKQAAFPDTKIFLHSLSITAGINWRIL